MLVISRKTDESFTIGDNIEVTLGKIRGNQVRLIIDAPKNVLINRVKLTKNNKNNKCFMRDQAKDGVL